MSRRLIRAEIEAQCAPGWGKRWADFILGQGEFDGQRDNFPAKPARKKAPNRPARHTTVAETYRARTGTTVAEAVARRYAAGMSISSVAREVGFTAQSSLRRYLRDEGIECPWPYVARTVGVPLKAAA